MTRDAFDRYCRDIEQYPLITPAEEVKLAKRIKRGDAKAREKLVNANLRLVIRIARSYETFGLPLMDLLSEGNIGLMKAAERFDPKHGCKFSTYAAFWIRQKMRRALSNQARIVRLPVHLVAKISKMADVIALLTDELNREPTDAEIASEMKLPVEKVEKWKALATSIVPLDAKAKDSDDVTVGEFVADANAVMPDDGHGDEIATMLEVISTLTTREQAVLRHRFGLDGSDPQTLEQVGAKFKITRERVRQIQNKCFEKLKVRIAERGMKHLAANV